MSNASFDVKVFLANLTTQPGVYRMLGHQGVLLYVGKARNLKKRVASYFQRGDAPSWVSQVAAIETTITHSETEALLLENSLIKSLQPKHNVLLRDDKSYPYILISDHPNYPRLDRYRGNKQSHGTYFGPYPSSSAVRETLQLLQKLFKLRQCQDSFFQNRSRPCLQYQIKRCSAPCVGFIDVAAYQTNVDLAKLFLQGKNQQIIEELIQRMEEASLNKAYEQAAYYRDLIASLRRIHDQQYLLKGLGSMDVIAAVQEGQVVCVQVMVIRHGQLLGQRAFFPFIPPNALLAEVTTAFLEQYYLHPQHPLPKNILLNTRISEVWWDSLQAIQDKKVQLIYAPRGTNQRWLGMAIKNAKHALQQQLGSKSQNEKRLQALQMVLQLETQPRYIECFDISHTQGHAPVGACVVFKDSGFSHADYRRFNVREIIQGDDYAALKQVLMRRYAHLKTSEQTLPDIVLIDGGKGQLHQAQIVMEELQIEDITLMAIAKGKARKPGLETIYKTCGKHIVPLEVDVNALHLLQQIRDEAHRYVITGHRRQRGKISLASRLEDIPGIGQSKRRTLLRQFGGLQEIKRASSTEIAKVPGISQALAERIYQAFHGGES